MHQSKIPQDKDISAVLTFLKESQSDLKELLKLFSKFASIKKNDPSHTLEKIMLWDEVLKRYEFFEEDTDINGERIKLITSSLKKLAHKQKIDTEWIDNINHSDRWNFDW